jgi:hypothetical protein
VLCCMMIAPIVGAPVFVINANRAVARLVEIFQSVRAVTSLSAQYAYFTARAAIFAPFCSAKLVRKTCHIVNFVMSPFATPARTFWFALLVKSLFAQDAGSIVICMSFARGADSVLATTVIK